MIIFAELAIILFNQYFATNSWKLRALCFAIICICAGGYLLTFYPAWMIPIAYMFIPFVIWVLVKNWKNIKLTKKDIIAILMIGIIFIGLIARIFIHSWDTIQTVLGTVYPGKRIELGGGQKYRFFESAMGLLLPLNAKIGNPCEYAMMFDLLPIALIAAFIVLIKEKKKDLCIILMLIVTIFLSIYCIKGFPELLSKVTFLSMSMGSRAVAVLGIEVLYILVMSLSQMEFRFSKAGAFILAEIFAILFVFEANQSNPDNVTLLFGLVAIFLLTMIYYFAMRANQNTNQFVVVMLVTMLLCGSLVNPLNTGTNQVLNSKLGNGIKEIVEEHPKSKWVVEGIGYPLNNYPMMLGASTINSTNVYPTLERWHKLDVNNQYEDVYNRYAHISITLDEAYTEPVFILVYPDVFEIKLNLKTLIEVLEVDYIVTPNKLEERYPVSEKLFDGALYIYEIEH